MSLEKVLVQNKKVGYNYEILDRFEAGIVLDGCEVKSIRESRASLVDAFAFLKGNELMVRNFYIAEYKNAKDVEQDPMRVKKLLLHRREINKIMAMINRKGHTVVPTKVYTNQKNIIKIELAVVTGKKKYDKRKDIKQREWEREKARILKNKGEQ